MRYWLAHILAGTGLAVGLALPLAASADTVTNWQDQVNVAGNGTVKVVETITYDPQDGNHHGIIRDIPATFSGNGHTYYTWIQPISVNDPSGAPYNIYKQTDDRNHLYLQIGDPNITISGPQTYVITYTIDPLVISAGDHDRLIFNLVGTSWQTNIQAASITVHYDNGTQITTVNCYTGAAGSTNSACTAGVVNGDAKAKLTQPLPAASAFTIDLTTPPNSVTGYLQPDKPIPLSLRERLSYLMAGAALLLVALSIIVMIIHKLADWRRRRRQTVVAQYEAPDGLKPAQLNMIDGANQSKMIAATLIDLAVRGYLKIDLLKPKTLFMPANYRFTMLKTNEGLAPYEAELFNAIFSTTNTIEMQDLKSKNIQMTIAIAKLKSDLGNDLKDKGYFASSVTSLRNSLNVGLLIVSISVLIFGIAFVFMGNLIGTWILAGSFAAALGGFILSLKASGRTRLGDEEWAKVEGFKLFLKVTEKDRLAFTDAPAKTPQLFSALLPAAIALNVEKEWAAQFAGIDIGPAVNGWYGGYSGVLMANSFGPDFSSSFASAVSSSFAGASGAGSAGGGGGGGGGGGW